MQIQESFELPKTFCQQTFFGSLRLQKIFFGSVSLQKTLFRLRESRPVAFAECLLT